jgi:hypothetical protein
MMFGYNLCEKWLELFKEIAPSVTHVAVLRDPTFAQGSAPSFKLCRHVKNTFHLVGLDNRGAIVQVARVTRHVLPEDDHNYFFGRRRDELIRQKCNLHRRIVALCCPGAR